MISYYRIYFDQEIVGVDSEMRYIYIYKELPTYEISQSVLCDFINDNRESISLSIKLNEYIYGIARYIPWSDEIRFPVLQSALYDFFIFPTPIKNKIPLYVTSKSIKTVQPLVIKNKLEIMDQLTATIIEEYGPTVFDDITSSIYHDYTFENSTEAATADQTSKYIMSRIRVSYDNLIKKAGIVAVSDAISDLEYNIPDVYNPVLSKAEVLNFITTLPSTQILGMKVNDSQFFIDGETPSKLYVVIKAFTFIPGQGEGYTPVSGGYTDPDNLATILPSGINSTTKWIESLYIQDKPATYPEAVISAIDLLESPYGNMYLIGDYDNELLELIYQDVIRIIKSQ